MNLMIVVVLFSLLIPFTSGLSFNLDSFNPGDQNITYENAYPASGIIQLTNNQANRSQKRSFGRATYYKPLHLWDKASGNITDFTTYFAFAIDSMGRDPPYGDGMAFFLAPEGSKLPPDLVEGSSLGLTKNGQQLNTTGNCFAAVEFDIFKNKFDAFEFEHVGININSMQSVSSTNWLADVPGGKINQVWISYNSTTYNLSVRFSGFRSNGLVLQHLSLIVDLRQSLPENVTFGFSAATGDLSAIHQIYSWSFGSASKIDKKLSDSLPPVSVPVPSPTPDPNTNPNLNLGVKKKMPMALWLGGGVGILAGGVGLILLVVVFWKRLVERAQDDKLADEYMDDEFRRGLGPKKFPYHQLARATNNFKHEAKLGEGGFGAVYKGFLKEMNLFVAVKKLSRGSKQGLKEYAAEVQIISQLRHRNLVKLIGWCHERKELLLVYEFMCNGSLDSHLFRTKNLLTWDVRYRIAQGLASGLLYLHEGWEKYVVHRDVKSSNIMLDSEFNAKLGDFGLARLVDHGKGMQTTMLAGTMGYMAPECATTGKASRESDIYSFGVVALEIACGRKPIIVNEDGSQMHVVEWVWEMYGSGKLLEAVDPKLHGDFDKPQMERLMVAGLWCAHPDVNLRPSIRQSIHVLKFEAPLPVLPSSIPVPMYFAPLQFDFCPLSLVSGFADSEGLQNQ